MPRSAPLTADELLHVNLPDQRTELVRGVLVVREKAGFRHGAVTMRLAKGIADHVDARGLGLVLAADTGFKLATDPDTVRAPDIAFIRRDRLPDPEPLGYLDHAPDLAVEVLSPGDCPGEVLTKVGDWLDAGTRLVWVVDPARRLVRVYRADGSQSVVAEHDVLDGEDVLPGFSCRLSAIW
ncbi:MAG: Uma2 family endonuclease [Gemmatimonadetes bacterium]|nr:Uma2 family endonuclease [Gemmatimonadota bacterium]